MVSLFDHGSTPAGSQFLDGTPGIKVGTTFNFDTAGQVTELWWYCGAQVGGTWTFTGWDITTGDSGGTGAGTQICTQAFVGTPTANAWNKVVLSPAVNVTGGNKRYRFTIHNGQYYWVNNNFFNAHDEINSPVNALRDGDTSSPLGLINQGTFTVGSSTTSYPQQTGTKANYAVDVTFVASGADAAAAFSLPAITAAGAATVEASGAAALTLPHITVAGAAIVEASGSAAFSLPHLTATGAATVEAFAASALALPPLALAGAGTAGVAGSAALTLPHITVTGAGETAPAAEAAIVLPALIVAGTAESAIAPVEEGGSWEGLLAPVNVARAAHRLAVQRRAHPLDCPQHHWPLQQAGPGRWHCKFGGHVVTHGE